MKKFLLASALLGLITHYSPGAKANHAQWMNLRDKLIYTPQAKSFKKSLVSSFATMPLWLIPLIMLDKRKFLLLYPILFGTSFLWLRYWGAKESKIEFMKFIQNWDENKKDTPEVCHGQFERLHKLLKKDAVKFDQHLLKELELLKLQISSHVDTSRII